jgi:hypothetical protein
MALDLPMSGLIIGFQKLHKGVLARHRTIGNVSLTSYTGTEVSATSSAFFIAYAKVEGNPGGDTPIIAASKYAIE